MKKQKSYKEKLGEMIKSLGIKDKALEMTLRELVFSNTELKVERVITKHMPEEKLK